MITYYEYDQAYDNLFRRIVVLAVTNDSQIGNIASTNTKHSGKLRQVFDPPWDYSPTKYESFWDMPGSKIRRADFQALNLLMNAAAEHIVFAHKRQLWAMITETSKRAGQQLPGDAALSWDNVLMAFEMMELRFDEDGQIVDYELWCDPVNANMALSDNKRPLDFDERLEIIVSKKKEKWDAKKRTRKLFRQS